MFKKFSIPFTAFLQVTALVIYIILITCFFSFAGKYLDNKAGLEDIFAPVIMLTLFVTSAVVSATLVLGRAGYLFWEKRYKEAYSLVLWDIIWGFVYFVLLIAYLLFLGKLQV